MFNNGEGGFKDRDLYVWCANARNRAEPSPLLALFGHPTRTDECPVWGQSGHDWNGPLCRLMTHSRHQVSGAYAEMI